MARPLIVACVLNGGKYSPEYVKKLKSMVDRHLPVEHKFVCLADRSFPAEGIVFQDLRAMSSRLPGWWAKMALFSSKWRQGADVIYFDLDTVIIGDLTPLVKAAKRRRFTICENFTRLAGHLTWPCKYGSCVMTINRSVDDFVWNQFMNHRSDFMGEAAQYGDQYVIEKLMPEATLLQDILPGGYFLARRDFSRYKDRPPERASVVVFAGNTKPHNTNIQWIKEAWR